MTKLSKKIIILITIILIAVLMMSTTVLAIQGNLDAWSPTKQAGNDGIFLARAGIVLGWIQYIGILVAVVALTFIGIKYLFSSVEGKAEYKKTMGPYVLGCFLLVGVSIIVGLIGSIVDPSEHQEGINPNGGIPVVDLNNTYHGTIPPGNQGTGAQKPSTDTEVEEKPDEKIEEEETEPYDPMDGYIPPQGRPEEKPEEDKIYDNNVNNII